MAVTAEPAHHNLPPPSNLTASWLTGGAGVLLHWNAALFHSLDKTSLRYSVEYRTEAQWTPLVDDLHNTSFVWKAASRGVVYQFRVRCRGHAISEAADSRPVKSHPSPAVILIPDGLSVFFLHYNFSTHSFWKLRLKVYLQSWSYDLGSTKMRTCTTSFLLNLTKLIHWQKLWANLRNSLREIWQAWSALQVHFLC